MDTFKLVEVTVEGDAESADTHLLINSNESITGLALFGDLQSENTIECMIDTKEFVEKSWNSNGEGTPVEFAEGLISAVRLIDSGGVILSEGVYKFEGDILKGVYSFSDGPANVQNLTKLEKYTFDFRGKFAVNDDVISGVAIADGVWMGKYFPSEILSRDYEKYKSAKVDVMHRRSKVGEVIGVEFTDIGVEISAKITDKETLEHVKEGRYRYFSSDFWLDVDGPRNVILGINKVDWVTLCTDPVCKLCVVRRSVMAKTESIDWSSMAMVMANGEGVTIYPSGTELPYPFGVIDEKHSIQNKPWGESNCAILSANGVRFSDTLPDFGNEQETIAFDEVRNEIWENSNNVVVVGPLGATVLSKNDITLSEDIALKWSDILYMTFGSKGIEVCQQLAEEEQIPEDVDITSLTQIISDVKEQLKVAEMKIVSLEAELAEDKEGGRKENMVEQEEFDEVSAENLKLSGAVTELETKRDELVSELDAVKLQLTEHETLRKDEITERILSKKIQLGILTESDKNGEKERLVGLTIDTLTELELTLSVIEPGEGAKLKEEEHEDKHDKLSEEQKVRLEMFGHAKAGGNDK